MQYHKQNFHIPAYIYSGSNKTTLERNFLYNLSSELSLRKDHATEITVHSPHI